MNNNTFHLTQLSTGTCWFFSMINGILKSPSGKRVLINALMRYIDTELVSDIDRREFLKPTATKPLYGNKPYSKFNFWKIIYSIYMSPLTTPSRNRRMMAANIFTNLRTATNPTCIDRAKHPRHVITTVLDRLGISNYVVYDINTFTVLQNGNLPSPDFILAKQTSDSTLNSISGLNIFVNGYNLETTSITFDLPIFENGQWINGAHAIAGVIINGRKYIVDSNSQEMIPCDWTRIENVRNNPYIVSHYHNITTMIYDYAIYYRITFGPVHTIPKSAITNALKLESKHASFTEDIQRATQMWEGYKMAFFNQNDATAILRANFLITYMLFKFEFAAATKYYPWSYNNTADVQRDLNSGKIHSALVAPNAKNKLGLNFFVPQQGFTGIMLLKNSKIARLVSNGKYVSITSPEYKAAEDAMVAECERIAQTITETKWKNIFQSAFMGQGSKFIDSAHYTSLGLFGWWNMFGIRGTSQGPMATERPGTCNVQGCLNMYLWKKKGVLDKIVYVAHGKKTVSRTAEINSITAERAAGSDDVEFCHHGWHMLDTDITNKSGMYVGGWWQKVLYSHSDAFDVLTLAPIFRARQRLIRQQRPGRAQYVSALVRSLNTRIKDFLENHLMSSLPSRSRTISMTANSRINLTNKIGNALNNIKNSRSNHNTLIRSHSWLFRGLNRNSSTGIINEIKRGTINRRQLNNWSNRTNATTPVNSGTMKSRFFARVRNLHRKNNKNLNNFNF